MSQLQHDTADDTALQEIMLALQSCYGSLAKPDFLKVHARMTSGEYHGLIGALQSSGTVVTDTTD